MSLPTIPRVAKSLLGVGVAVGVLAVGLASARTQTPSVEGVRNFSQVSTTIGCGGATAPEAMAELASMGYVSVINFRRATEAGVDVEAGRAAAEAAGMKYIHLPFHLTLEDREATVDRFLTEVTQDENLPAFLHCGSANRVGGLWMIKRMLVDGWDADRAGQEAEAIGLRSQEIRQFALDYVDARR